MTRFTAACVQLVLRSGHAELVEEDPGQVVVVVLSGVDDDLVEPLAQQAGDRSRLYELRTVADDRDDQPAASSWSMRCRRAEPTSLSRSIRNSHRVSNLVSLHKSSSQSMRPIRTRDRQCRRMRVL